MSCVRSGLCKVEDVYICICASHLVLFPRWISSDVSCHVNSAAGILFYNCCWCNNTCWCAGGQCLRPQCMNVCVNIMHHIMCVNSVWVGELVNAVKRFDYRERRRTIYKCTTCTLVVVFCSNSLLLSISYLLVSPVCPCSSWRFPPRSSRSATARCSSTAEPSPLSTNRFSRGLNNWRRSALYSGPPTPCCDVSSTQW